MQEFKRFYIWGMNAKQIMGLYFAALVFLGGILTAVFGGDALRLTTLLQMMLTSMAVAFVQTAVLPDSTDFSGGIFTARSVGWLLFVGAATVAVSWLGNWFAGLPSWCPWLMGLFAMFGCGALLVGFMFEQEADTRHLNESLERYQSNR